MTPGLLPRAATPLPCTATRPLTAPARMCLLQRLTLSTQDCLQIVLLMVKPEPLVSALYDRALKGSLDGLLGVGTALPFFAQLVGVTTIPLAVGLFILGGSTEQNQLACDSSRRINLAVLAYSAAAGLALFSSAAALGLVRCLCDSVYHLRRPSTDLASLGTLSLVNSASKAILPMPAYRLVLPLLPPLHVLHASSTCSGGSSIYAWYIMGAALARKTAHPPGAHFP